MVLKRLIFWEFPRTTWQYDVVVGLILAFIFLTPRTVFNDEPRAPGIVRLPAQNGLAVFFIEPSLLRDAPESELAARAEQLMAKRLRRPSPVERVQAVAGEDGAATGYMVYLKR